MDQTTSNSGSRHSTETYIYSLEDTFGMFTVALCIIASNWRLLKCPSAVEWIDCDIYTQWWNNKAKKVSRLELNATRLVNSFCESIYVKVKDRLNQWVSVWYNIFSQGAFDNVWRHLWLSQLEEARNTAIHSAMHRTISHNKVLPSLSIMISLR